MNKPPDETLKQGRNRSWLLVEYVRKNQIVENKLDIIIRNKNGSNQMKIIRDPIISQYLSETSSIDQDWKLIASKSEIKSYKKGRLGNYDIQMS